ncbi:MAG: dihydropteroate synthase [Persicimonas sp.]
MAFFGSPTTRPTPGALRLAEGVLTFDQGYRVMGVLNVTPDSFSDGGEYLAHEDAIDRGLAMVEAGADIIDVGGESTRPGAAPVSVDAELSRVVPVIEALSEQTDAHLSIDTTKAMVAEAALEAGAHIVNDISGLGFDAKMADVVAQKRAALILMHIRGTPRTMQSDIDYDDVVDDILAYFEERIEVAQNAGIDAAQIAIDPGIGFGKTVSQNYRLIRELHRFFDLGRPLLLGTSRKSFIGAVLGKPPAERVWGTAATVACGLYAGADIVRVHDVAQMVDVVRVTEALCGHRPETKN